MQLYFIEGAPFWGVPFNMIDQFPVLEATLVTSEQIAVFAFSLMKDEWCDSLYDEIVDSIYLLYAHENAPRRVNKATQAIIVLDNEQDDPTKSNKRRKVDLQGADEAGPSTEPTRPEEAVSDSITLRWHRKKMTPYEALDVLAGEIVSFCEATMSTGAVVFDRKTVKDALHNMCNTQKNGLMVLTQNPLDEKVELTMNKSLFGQIKGNCMCRSRHGAIMDMCKESVQFKHAHPGPYVIGTPYIFPMPLNETMKKKLLSDKVTRVINQFCGYVSEVDTSDAFKPLRSISKRPGAKHMAGEFMSAGVQNDPGMYVQNSVKTYSENPVLALQKNRLETLGIPLEEAQRQGIMLSQTKDESFHLQRLVRKGGVRIETNPERDQVTQTIIRQALGAQR
jgi:hypothetical protein